MAWMVDTPAHWHWRHRRVCWTTRDDGWQGQVKVTCTLDNHAPEE